MKTFIVDFVQYHTYTVEAETEEQAEILAYNLYISDMHSPIASAYHETVIVREE